MAECNLYPHPLSSKLDDPDSPEWQEGGRVHNWQNYIGKGSRRLWASLSDEWKIALAEDADEIAGREDWD